jgi:predicted O-methyltransferase YrrM
MAIIPTQAEAEFWANSPSPFINRARAISMLDERALSLLERLAMLADGPIIELGSYIGGSTIALSAGSRHKVFTVEIGGENQRGDYLSSPDIIADLRRNLAAANLAERVSIMEGHFRAAAVFDRVHQEVGDSSAGLLFVDIDPGTELALGLYAALLRDDAFVVVDDYASEIAVDKAALVSGFIKDLVTRGILLEIGVFGWGTWFGKLAGHHAKLALGSGRGQVPRVPETGLCWHSYVGYEHLSDDRNGNRSPLLLFEDGRKLGPAQSLHAKIRTHGRGRYSHWGGKLWFSSSDGTDPRFNGRRYSIQVRGQETDLSEPSPLPSDDTR